MTRQGKVESQNETENNTGERTNPGDAENNEVRERTV